MSGTSIKSTPPFIADSGVNPIYIWFIKIQLFNHKIGYTDIFQRNNRFAMGRFSIACRPYF